MTIVAVAHRLATIQKADVIFVFGESQNGNGSTIVEQGSHQELLRSKGMYWQMVSIKLLLIKTLFANFRDFSVKQLGWTDRFIQALPSLLGLYLSTLHSAHNSTTLYIIDSIG
jgi:hypothetical protein